MVRTQPVAVWLGVACLGAVLSQPTTVAGGLGQHFVRAKVILPRPEVPRTADRPVLADRPTFRTYLLPGGNAEAVANTLRGRSRVSPDLRIAAVDANTILVYGCPDDVAKVRKEIQGLRAGAADK
jgi:hypothetical protein